MEEIKKNILVGSLQLRLDNIRTSRAAIVAKTSILSLNKWIELSKYEPDINQTDIRSGRKFLHHTE